jgi:hypothetical protein
LPLKLPKEYGPRQMDAAREVHRASARCVLCMLLMGVGFVGIVHRV